VTSETRSVYRYFEPADVFVRIHVCDAGALGSRRPARLDRAGYRRLVLGACIPEYGAEIAPRLEELAPDDPLLLEDLLYQLCVEVNPTLDIHTVRLAEGGPQHASEAETEGRGQGLDYEDYRQDLLRRARGLSRRLLRCIVGQDRAVETVSRAVEKAAVGLATPGRPLGAFLFVGRTGTGKTELARALAADLFGHADGARGARRGLVRIDCAEYALAHEYSKLIGAPPGYVGHEDGGQLTEAVMRSPESVVLFDEVEKANPRMHNLLLSILEEGCLTDGKGRRVSFERTLVLLTSNAGASEMVAAQRTVGFERSKVLGSERLQEVASEALQRQFSPEFLGRLDETIVFEELGPAHARQIAQRQLSELARRAREARMRVAFAPSVAKWVARRGFSPEYGARELRRVIRREVESPLSQLLLERGPRAPALVRVRIRGDAPSFALEG
jgi:ATP-dependent Clp protease ATP-binding subunit ClpC